MFTKSFMRVSDCIGTRNLLFTHLLLLWQDLLSKGLSFSFSTFTSAVTRLAEQGPEFFIFYMYSSCRHHHCDEQQINSPHFSFCTETGVKKETKRTGSWHGNLTENSKSRRPTNTLYNKDMLKMHDILTKEHFHYRKDQTNAWLRMLCKTGDNVLGHDWMYKQAQRC